ncbi:PQQ-dependent sugar dehydrogenase [Deinococcus radiomollis]|uniref:PQQ-dependent sugar dehydrogenase n=1 Tax=Deinococcus radiomollis TaxID=468916 RepID=UPI003891B520
MSEQSLRVSSVGRLPSFQSAQVFRSVLAAILLGCSFQFFTPVLAQSRAANVRDATLPPIVLPAGFRASVYASGLAKPRLMAVAPNGDVALSDMKAGRIYLLRGSQKAQVFTFASGLDIPHGLAFHGGFLYVATQGAVLRYPYRSGDTRASGAAERVVALSGGGEHVTRTLSFGPDGRLYVSTGSSCNACRETDPRRASVWSYAADGTDGRLYASGLRNAIGMAWKGGALYVSNNGRDYLGDTTPPEGFYRLKQGGFYGWPTCFTVGGRVVNDPAYRNADCRKASAAFATVHAHSAPMDLALYTGSMFPAAYQGKFLAALHGSSMNAVPVGDKVVLLDPATGRVQDFLTGLVRSDGYFNRPVGLAVLPDGSLLVSDDWAGKVYRISYGK